MVRIAAPGLSAPGRDWLFIVAIFVRGASAKAIRIALVFGVALYAVFTFAWTPLHYLHLMFITLVATVLLAIALSRMMGAPTASGAPDSTR